MDTFQLWLVYTSEQTTCPVGSVLMSRGSISCVRSGNPSEQVRGEMYPEATFEDQAGLDSELLHRVGSSGLLSGCVLPWETPF